VAQSARAAGTLHKLTSWEAHLANTWSQRWHMQGTCATL